MKKQPLVKKRESMLIADFSDEKFLEGLIKQKIPASPYLNNKNSTIGLIITNNKKNGNEQIALRYPNDIQISDFTGYAYVVMDFENLEDDIEWIYIIFYDCNDKFDDNSKEPALFWVEVPAKQRTKWKIPLLHLDFTGSPLHWPKQNGLGQIGSSGLANIKEIKEIVIGSSGHTVLYSLNLEDPIKWVKWIDRFGQRMDMTWPGKILRVSDYTIADQIEKKILNNFNRSKNRDIYQAWTGKEPKHSTGFFRTDKIDGRWWLIAPYGNLYFITGLNCVTNWIEALMNDRVIDSCSWLPSNRGKFAKAWHKPMKNVDGMDWISLYRVNLIRKWGREFEKRFCRRTFARLFNWEVTSIGAWSEKKITNLKRLPYVSEGPHGKLNIPKINNQLLNNSIIEDAFHPDFESETKRIAKDTISHLRDDPWLIGHFLKNEIEWKDFIENIFNLNENTPTKRVLLSRLKQHYSTIGNLNKAWKTSAKSFKLLRWSIHPTDDAKNFMNKFQYEFADRWFRGWTNAIRTADPNHLVLGSRMYPLETHVPVEFDAVKAKYFDVISFNIFEYYINPEPYERLNMLVDKPMMVSEFSHNSLDTGLLTAAVSVKDRKQRGVAYRFFTEQLAALPFFVGCHYFQYLDAPITGRFDGETQYNGLVDVTDTPHYDLANAVKITNSRIYEVHSGEIKPFSIKPF